MSNATAITTENAPPFDGIADSRLVGVGVSLEALRANVALAEHGLDGGAIRAAPLPNCPIPPAVLLPRVSGEPLRIDLMSPPHPRGTGDAWPPESVLRTNDGGGRLPLAFVWPALLQDARREWQWTTPEGVTQRVSPAEAIAGAFAALVDPCAKQSEEPLVLVVPNRLRMDRQQELIDACWSHGCRIKLLWRPVAAALAWVEQQAAGLLERTNHQDGSVGKLLCLHLGLDEFEATPLELVVRPESGNQCLLPARSRPSAKLPPFPSFGLELLVRHAGSKSGHRTSDDTNELWREMWTTYCPFEAMSALSTREVDRPAISQQMIGGDDWRVVARVGNWFPPPKSFRDFENWLGILKKELHQEQWLGVMVTGELATTQLIGQKRLWAYCLDAITNESARQQSLVDGSPTEPRSMLARGAAIYAARLAEGRLAYLDSLPRIRTATYQSGVASWLDLLNPDDSYVEGGKPWHRPKPVDGLKIQMGQTCLDVALWHDEFPTARKVTATFPDAVVTDVPITLDVSVEPAQGNAHVEVIPRDAGTFGTRRLFLEWRRMEDLGMTPDDWLASLPRLFPGTLKRIASPTRWPTAESTMALYLQSPSTDNLETAIRRLSQKDQTIQTQPNEEATATAISSDGEPPRGSSRILDTFVEYLVERVAPENRRPGSDKIRALTYTSTSNVDFQRYLIRRLKEDGTALERHNLAASGWCLSEPKKIAMFAKVLERFLRDKPPSPNNWLKAFAEMLRYREHATCDIPSELGEKLTAQILDFFEYERTVRRSAKFLFRNSCLCIVYLLRRRAFDDDYLRPESELAEKVKAAFSAAITDLKGRRLQAIGGTIRLGQALQTMIDYINRNVRLPRGDDGLRDVAEKEEE